MNDFDRVLIAGTGPTCLQLAVALRNRLTLTIGIAGRRSARSATFYREVERGDRTIRADVQNDAHAALAGECRVDALFQGYDTVTGEWPTLVLSVTADAYTQVLASIDPQILRGLGCVVLVSPTFGSNSLVRSYLRSRGADAEVISLSSYLGDTRWPEGTPSDRVLTAAVKRRLYIGSSHGRSANLELVCDLHRALGVTVEVVDAPMEAETRNISLYVHPALFMNDISLDAVFGESGPVRYVYKLVPEGPIAPPLINDMVNQWRELTELVEKLGLTGVNLLRFMLDDSYPVRPESISRDEIERFATLPQIHQEYLVYVRYASLLIDPFSEPDAQGRYFDFSAIPIRRVFVDGEGRWDVPRMPKEDYYRTKIIQGVAQRSGAPCPTIDKLLAGYERALVAAARARTGEPMTDAFTVQDFSADVDMICAEIARTR